MRGLLTTLLLGLLSLPSTGQDDSVGPEEAGFQPLVILSPLPDSSLSGDEPLEVSALLSGADGLDIILFIDSVNVTARAELADDYVFYLSPEPPAAGAHRISVYGLSLGDTLWRHSWAFLVNPAPAFAGAAAMPWESSIGLGWQHGSCDRDTAGLGLAAPVGHQPSGDAFFSGPLWGGLVQGSISYDRSYDREPHGLLQASLDGLELSLGEFHPGFSSLAFANALPLGLLGRSWFGPVSLDFTACRTASADTALSSFAQYLYGGRAGLSLGDSLSLGLGYLQGRDQPSSLPDSVRYRATTFVLTDTIFGLTDTMVFVDTLRPASNRIGWLSARKAMGRYSLELEAAGTRTYADDGGRSGGWGCLARVGRSSRSLDFSLAYSSTDAGFRSFGSPYLETAKNELEGLLQAGRPGGLRTTLQGNVYKAFTDSAPGLGWGLGAGWGLRAGAFSSLSLRLDYAARPYRAYRYQNRGLSAGLGFSALGARIYASYGYNFSSSPGTTQSHNASAEVSRPLYRRLATAALGHQYYQARDVSGSSDREKHALTASLSGDLSASLSYRLQARRIAQTDRVDPGQGYRQDLVSANLIVNF